MRWIGSLRKGGRSKGVGGVGGVGSLDLCRIQYDLYVYLLYAVFVQQGCPDSRERQTRNYTNSEGMLAPEIKSQSVKSTSIASPSSPPFARDRFFPILSPFVDRIL